jgi:long-chain acyl-CoA synthetase
LQTGLLFANKLGLMCQHTHTQIHDMEIVSLNSLIEKSIIDNWNRDALTDFKGATLQYHDVARKIEKLHIMFENSGVQQGDKIALCGRNSACWAVAFLATLTYGAVAVPILHEFTAEQIHNIVNHSGAKLLFVGDVVATVIDATKMPDLEGIIYIPDYSLVVSRTEKLTYAREHLNEMFGKKFPKYFRQEHVHYRRETSGEEMALINYTSGTTGFSKGVMIPYRAMWSNYDFAMGVLGSTVKAGDSVISILPMAHMYGMSFEFFFEFLHGCHIYYLTRVPSPAIIAQAFSEVKPAVIIAVPLVIEKIIRKKVFPKIQNNRMRLLLNMPVLNRKVNQKICEQVKNAFGGRFYEIIIGGAAFNQEVEQFLKRIDFPYTVGYGATECAPIICYADYHDFVPGSCGKPVVHMEVRIDSEDPENVPGEILARGLNVMLGYYKNEEATRQALDKDGWYHTGDLGTMDANGNVFIKGRSKNMLLSANGQNIYPEEIEDKLNSMALVNESIVIQQGDKLVGLVHPDYDEAKGMRLTNDDIVAVMEQNRQELNAELPAYSKLSTIKIQEEEFEKTPKKSIKRYLYQNV